MSSPETRLVGDVAAEKFAVQAAAILAGPVTMPVLSDLASAIVLLTRDRQARQEMALARSQSP